MQSRQEWIEIVMYEYRIVITFSDDFFWEIRCDGSEGMGKS